LLVVDDFLLNWSAHWRRLRISAARLQFAALDEPQLLQHIAQSIHLFDPLSCSTKVVKVLVSRGEAGRGYAIPKQASSQVWVQVSTAPIQVECLQQTPAQAPILNFPPPMALQLERCQTQVSIQIQLAGIKHLNRLDSVLAQTEVREKQHQEGIMQNAFDQVICGTQSNVFLIKGQTILTPKLHLSGVEGTIRYQLQKLAAGLGFRWKETEIDWAQLQQADELFLSNAVRGIMPIQQFETTSFATEQSTALYHAWNQWQATNSLCLKSLCLKNMCLKDTK
ncbi:Aminodeoxychorismate lyase, partial [hydrothermal vent metagenome]